jgi:hypothetical protein
VGVVVTLGVPVPVVVVVVVAMIWLGIMPRVTVGTTHKNLSLKSDTTRLEINP